MRALAIAIIALLAAGCQPGVEERAAASKALIDRYCTDCHNDAERTGELTLEGVALTDVGAHAEVWESVVRKLRGRMMPPAGEPLPEGAAADELVAYLEEQLDRNAAANPNPGVKSLHRLNRTEYGNAIRDLLALDIDASAYLPNDSEAYGFDNIADVLGTDPSLLDRYLLDLADVPPDSLRPIWQDGSEPGAWDSPVYAYLIETVRRANRPLPPAERIRVLAGEPPIDWSLVESAADLLAWGARGAHALSRLCFRSVPAPRPDRRGWRCRPALPSRSRRSCAGCGA